ncbi:MAG: hypothetical protein ABL903_02320 [Methylococcales bacterium]
MKLFKNLLLICLMLLHNMVWAYGGGGSSSTKACAKPKFSEFAPAEKTEVKANAEFSFIASANTYPESIKVSIKDVPVTVNVADKNGTAFQVTGKLPSSIKDSYARISINAEGANKCKGTGGWLLKISQ